jgi:hypothetical protein
LRVFEESKAPRLIARQSGIPAAMPRYLQFTWVAGLIRGRQGQPSTNTATRGNIRSRRQPVWERIYFCSGLALFSLVGGMIPLIRIYVTMFP